MSVHEIRLDTSRQGEVKFLTAVHAWHERLRDACEVEEGEEEGGGERKGAPSAEQTGCFRCLASGSSCTAATLGMFIVLRLQEKAAKKSLSSKIVSEGVDVGKGVGWISRKVSYQCLQLDLGFYLWRF